ncbi:hypothetical protein [Glaciihabitans sp. dw_435]|uniref:hypothetical protein n=1 Tax=Glaciihabitans sp. dw_435 TaxID=2720081 RepID=UPI001BD4E11F|nr:hypothetical protein [Glaciihabitans sp. dw_435]
MRRTAIPIAGVATVISLLVVLAGCAAQPTTSSSNSQETAIADPAQVRTDLYKQLDKAQALLGGAWDNADDPSPMECTAGSSSGVTFTGNRGSNDVVAEEMRAQVASLWEGMGFTTRMKDDVAPYRLVIATSPSDPENTLTFGLSDNAMYLEGQGACGAGDISEWVDIVNKELAAKD